MPQKERDREATMLGLQWAIWKHLQYKLVLDGAAMQTLAEDLARDFYNEGVRIALDDDPEDTPLNLSADVFRASKEMGPVAMPDKQLRERIRKLGMILYDLGWRRYAPTAA